MDKKMQERAIKAATNFMKRCGYEVLDTCWKAEDQDEVADLVVMDDDTLVIAKVRFVGYDVEDFHEEDFDREAFERLAAAYLSTHDIVNAFVRCDIVTLLGIGESKALLRHRRGVSSAA